LPARQGDSGRGRVMYLIKIDHLIYVRRGGGLFTLPEAMREVYGVRGAQVLRADGTVAVRDAGSSVEVTHAPTGRVVRR
jgi:hypothetical protein